MTKQIHYLFILAVAFTGWRCSSEAEAAPVSTNAESAAVQPLGTIPTYRTIEAQPRTAVNAIKLTGRLQAIEQLQLVAEVQGKTLPTGKLLNEGVRYRVGETMIQIEDDQYRLNLNAQRSQFQAALVRIMSQVKLDYPDAHAAWDGYLRKFNNQEALPELPDVTDDQLRFFLSANNIFSSYYSIKSAEEILPKYRIRAPFTGVITQGNLAPGAVVSPGTPIASFSRTDTYELKAAVSVSQIDQLSQGQKIKLTQRNTGQSYSGTIHRIGGTIDPSTQAVPVYIRVSGKGLRENLFLETSISAGSKDDIVALPLTALNRDNQVHLIKDSTVFLLDVEPVRFSETEVYVRGFKGGEQVIIESINEPIVGSKAVSQF